MEKRFSAPVVFIIFITLFSFQSGGWSPSETESLKSEELIDILKRSNCRINGAYMSLPLGDYDFTNISQMYEAPRKARTLNSGKLKFEHLTENEWFVIFHWGNFIKSAHKLVPHLTEWQKEWLKEKKDAIDQALKDGSWTQELSLSLYHSVEYRKSKVLDFLHSNLATLHRIQSIEDKTNRQLLWVWMTDYLEQDVESFFENIFYLYKNNQINSEALIKDNYQFQQLANGTNYGGVLHEAKLAIRDMRWLTIACAD